MHFHLLWMGFGTPEHFWELMCPFQAREPTEELSKVLEISQAPGSRNPQVLGRSWVLGEFKDSKGITIPGDLIIKGNLTTDGNLTTSGKFNYLPTGTILAYNKTVAPKGWALCDGQNNTPDL